MVAKKKNISNNKQNNIKAKKKRGRPPLVTKKILDICGELSVLGFSIARIADLTGISSRTLERNVEFCRIYKKGVANVGTRVRTALLGKAESGDVTSMIYLDKTINRALNAKEEADIALKKEELSIRRKQAKVEGQAGKLVLNVIQAKDAPPQE